MCSPCLSYKIAVRIVIVVRRTTVSLLRAKSVCSVFVDCGYSAFGRCSKLPSVLPCEAVRTAVVVRKRISYVVICYRRSVIGSESIKPRCVCISVAFGA